MEGYSKIVAKNIIALRKSRNLTQQDFAKVINYSDKTVSKWELGYAIPSVETLKQIADYFGVTVDFFLEPHEEITSKGVVRLMNKETRRLLLLSLIDLFFLSAAAVGFAAMATTFAGGEHYWPIFLWAISLCFFFNSFCANKWWRHTIWPYVLVSSTIWSILISLYLTLIYSELHYNFWYLFFVGLPIQLAAIIILSLTHSTSK